jgi:hypothetical protein
MNQVIRQTQNWLKHSIIAHNFCPFAKNEFVKERIHYEVMPSDLVQTLHVFMQELLRLDQSNGIETSLLIYPEGLSDFEDFLDYHAIAEQYLYDEDYEGIYQLATFHPDYCFADSDNNDPANYTNRSPYPTLHILREASLEQKLKHYSNPEAIPQRNIQTAHVLGIDTLRDLLTRIQNDDNM